MTQTVGNAFLQQRKLELDQRYRKNEGRVSLGDADMKKFYRVVDAGTYVAAACLIACVVFLVLRAQGSL